MIRPMISFLPPLNLKSLFVCTIVTPITTLPGLGAVIPLSLPLDVEPDGDKDSDHELDFLPKFFLSPLAACFPGFLGEGSMRLA